MGRYSFRSGALPILLLLGVAGLHASGQAPARTDPYGDPLPPGALTRLGVSRLVSPIVNRLLFLRDGKTLATANFGTIQLWDVRSGKLLWRVKPPLDQRGFPARFRALAFTADGKRAAAGCDNRTLHLWDTATGRELASLAETIVSELAFSPDGRRLATWGVTGPIRLMEAVSGKMCATTADLQHVIFLGFTTDGKALLSGHREPPRWDTTIFTWWDPVSGKKRKQSKVTERSPWAGTLAPSGRYLATRLLEGKSIRLVLLDPETGKEVARPEEGLSSPPSVAFSADGRFLAASRSNGSVGVWESATGKALYNVRVPKTLAANLALAPGGDLLAVATRESQELLLYDSSGKRLHSFPGHRSGVLEVAFAPDGKSVLTASRAALRSEPVQAWAEWSLRRWAPASGKELRVTRADPGGEVRYTAFSADGRLVATVLHDGTLRLWDTATGKELRRWRVPTRIVAFRGGAKVFQTPLLEITEPVFSGDGKLLLAAHEKRVYRWDVATGEELPPVEHGLIASYPRCFAMANSRTVLVAAAERSRRLILLDLENGTVLRDYPVGRAHLQSVAVSHDGRTIALADGKGLRLLETETGRERASFVGEIGFGRGLAFSPCGRLVAVAAGRGNAIQVWRLPAGKPQRSFTAGEGQNDSLCFSPDSRRLASCGYVNTALVWDVAGLLGRGVPARR